MSLAQRLSARNYQAHRGLMLVDLEGTLLNRHAVGAGTRNSEGLEPLRHLSRRDLSLVLQTQRQVIGVRDFYIPVLDTLSLPVERVYCYFDLKVHPDVLLTHERFRWFKNFQLVLAEAGVPYDQANKRVVNVEDYHKKVSFAGPHPPFYRENSLSFLMGGYPLPLPGGHLLAATIMVPGLKTPDKANDLQIFNAVVQMTEAIVTGSFVFPDAPLDQVTMINAVGARWAYFPTAFILNGLVPSVRRHLGVEIPALTAWQERGCPPQRFLFYIPE